MEDTIYDKIKSDRYKNKMAWPVKSDTPEEKKEARKAYSQEEGRLSELFYRDCCEFNEVNADNPKTRKVFNKAYEMGHSAGHSEVYNYFYGLIEFVESLGVDLK